MTDDIKPLIEKIEIFKKDGRPMVSSLKVAQHFGKYHKNVIRAIERLECSKEFNGLNFERVEYRDKKGEIRLAYEMTEEGFSFLAFGFTGRRAASWKEAYITAFKKMRMIIESPDFNLSPSPMKAIEKFTGDVERDRIIASQSGRNMVNWKTRRQEINNVKDKIDGWLQLPLFPKGPEENERSERPKR